MHKRILNITTAQPGFRVGYKQDDGSIVYDDVVLWALVSNGSYTYVEPMVVDGEFGNLALASGASNYGATAPPGKDLALNGYGICYIAGTAKPM